MTQTEQVWFFAFGQTETALGIITVFSLCVAGVRTWFGRRRK